MNERKVGGRAIRCAKERRIHEYGDEENPIASRIGSSSVDESKEQNHLAKTIETWVKVVFPGRQEVSRWLMELE